LSGAVKIFIGENSGFCFGVKRAVDKALELAQSGKVYSLGYIIHNEQAVQKLKEAGVETKENPEDIPSLNGAKVIIRTHGVKKQVIEDLKKRKIEFFDATCPFVIRSQRIVEKLSDQGYGIIIFGNPDHPEVIGVVSYVKTKNFFIVQKPEDVDSIPYMKKVAVISQTTQRLDDFIEVVKRIIEKGFEIRVFNTVCEVTVDAQKEAKEIAELSDVVIVVGGKMSSNTEKLYKVCKNLVEAHKIETADELEKDWVLGKEKIGIVAGTSTPDWVVLDVIKKIKDLLGNEKIEIVRVGKKNKFSVDVALWEV